MFSLFFLIVSYGTFLLLLMPATTQGIIFTAAAFVIGTILLVLKKPHKSTFQKKSSYFLISILSVIACGLAFYNRWLPSSKMQAIASICHMSIRGMLVLLTLIFSVLSIYFLYTLLQIIAKKTLEYYPKNYFERGVVFSVVVAIVTVILAQIMIDVAVLSMGYFRFFWGVLVVSVVILLLFCLLGRIIPSVTIGAGIFMLISTINVYVYNFRGRMFEPVDIFTVGTVKNVAESYSLFPIPSRILIGWAIFAAMMMFLYSLQRKPYSKPEAKKRYSLLTICAIGVVSILFYAGNLKTYHWAREGAYFNGYVLDFISKFKEISPPMPDHYSSELIDKLADQYAIDNDTETQTEPSDHPHIFVIMDEAFSDLSVAGDFSTNMEVMPFISSLKEDVITGRALVSVYGGNTANSEYEFLTGNSMAWLSPNVVPYQQYIQSPTYSMVSYLMQFYNYKCVAMHPFHASGWNRPAAYEYLGFDECHFVEDFPHENYVRQYISDQEMFEYLIETYEAQKDNPLFIFGVTMQNHGGYTYAGENYNKSIVLNDLGDEYSEVEQYLSLIHETDKAVENLITYFQSADDDVVIVFFGDHQPRIDDSFYETISGTSANTLDEQQKRYEVPFFIWANYDIEEEYLDCVSLNYLSSYVYNAADITLPSYNKFLHEMEEVIPAVNANGFFSLSAGHFLPFEEADEEELRWLELYQILQYNSTFDKKHRSESFFPTLE